jgi:hypothetical protein
MDRLKERLAALAEEVGEFAQPPGAAVTVHRARRRRHRAVAVLSLALVAVVAVGSPLERLGSEVEPGQVSSGPSRWALLGSVSPSEVRRGQWFTVRLWGCPDNFIGEISVDFGLGIQPSGAIAEVAPNDGGLATRIQVPPDANPGTYHVLLSCYPSQHEAEDVQRRLDEVTVLPS